MVHLHNILIGTCLAAIFAVYIQTLSPSIAGGDSGELVAEGCALGTAHPPGYPLLTLVVYLLKGIPFGTVAYKVNILSAFFTTLASWGIVETVKVVSGDGTKSTPGAILAAATFSFSPLIWQYAVTAEVFPLNTMLASVLVMLCAKFARTGDVRLSFLGAWVCGLALCNQHTIVLYVVPLVLWMLFLQRHTFLEKPSLLVWHGVMFLAGFGFYIYLPAAAVLNPTAGSWGDVSSVSGFMHHFLRKDYGTFQLFSGSGGKTSEGFSERTMAYLEDATITQGLYIIPLLALGASVRLLIQSTASLDKKFVSSRKAAASSAARVSKKKEKRAAGSDEIDSGGISPLEASHTPTVLVGTLVFYFLVFHSLSNLPLKDKLLYGVHQRFWMQPNVLLFALGGVGFNSAVEWVEKSMSQKTNKKSSVDSDSSRSADRSVSKGNRWVQGLAIVVAVGLSACQLNRSYPMSDQSQAFYFRDYARALLAPLPADSLLLINYDMQWTSVRYMQKCEDLRPDVTVINLSMMTYQWFKSKRNLYPHLKFPGGWHSYENSPAVRTKAAFTLSQFVDANIDSHPIFLSGKLSFKDSVFERKYEHVPIGLVSRIESIDRLPNGTSYTPMMRSSWKKVRTSLQSLPDPLLYPEETWEWTIGRDFKDRLADSAAFYLEAALKVTSVDYKPIMNAIYTLESAVYLESLAGGGKAPTSLLKNTGLAHVNLVQNKLIPPGKPLPLPLGDVFNTTTLIEWPTTPEWKKWSTDRFVATWGEFLTRPDARADPQYEQIKKMYNMAVSK